MAAADRPAAEPKNPSNAGRSHRWTAHAGTTAAAPRPPWALAAPGRQDHRAEPDPFAGDQIRAAVIHPRRPHRDRTRGSHYLALAGMAVADHQPPATLIPLGGVGGEVSVDLGLQGGTQHPPSTLAYQLVQVQAQLVLRLGVGSYTQHAAFLPAGVHHAGASRTCHPGRYAALPSPDPIHNFRSYLARQPAKSLAAMEEAQALLEQARLDDRPAWFDYYDPAGTASRLQRPAADSPW